MSIVRFWRTRKRRGKSLLSGLLVVATVIGAAAGWLGFDLITQDGGLEDGQSVGEGRTLTVDRIFTACRRGNRDYCVIDGDTVRVAGNKIRIADINAPETHSPLCAAESELGARASRRLAELLSAGPFVVMTTGRRDRDRYGRQLRVLERGGQSIGDQLVAEGFAHRWRGHKESWC